MNILRKKTLAITGLLIIGAFFSTAAGGCSEAKTIGENISTDADNFKIQRKIVGINTRTMDYLFYVEGKCSIEPEGDKLIALCKYAENDYRKQYMGKGNDVFWSSIQTEGIAADAYRTKIVLKPEGIIPDLELNLSNG